LFEDKRKKKNVSVKKKERRARKEFTVLLLR
jgi:hypothetical protein